MADDEYTPEKAALDALCTAGDRRAAQYMVPGATDDDLALADAAFMNDVHQAILRSEWLAAHDESVRAQERERILSAIERSLPGGNDVIGGFKAGVRAAARIVREGS